MSASKVRHIDFYPDEYLAGVSGKLTPEQMGVYWTICTLIYSKGKPVDNDPKWLGNIMGGTHPRTMQRIIKDLLNMGKLTAEGGALMVQRCRKELAKTEERIGKARANGELGGRPSNKNNDLDKPDGFDDEKLTTNHQPSTINQPTNKEIIVRFTEWYSRYPKKVNPRDAEKAYCQAIKKDGATFEDLEDGLTRFLDDIQTNKTERQFIKGPGPWIRAGGYASEYEPKRVGAKW